MKNTMTKKEAINLYGSERLKEHFNKYGKITCLDMKVALEKTLEQHFDSVEEIRQGRSKVYLIGNKRHCVADRPDGRQFNGENNKLKYTHNFDIIVLSELQKNLVTQNEQTMRKWLFDIGLINKNLFNLMGAKTTNNIETKHMSYLSESGILETEHKSVLNDFRMYTRDLQGQLQRSLKRLEKAGIIELYEVKKARVIKLNEEGELQKPRKTIQKNEEGQLENKVGEPVYEYEVVELDKITWVRIIEKRKELMSKHRVNGFEIQNMHNKENVKQFNEEFTHYLRNDVEETLGFGKTLKRVVVNFWTAWGIEIKCTDNIVVKYLQNLNRARDISEFLQNQEEFIQNNKHEYVEERFKHVVERAESKRSRAIERAKMTPEEEAEQKELLEFLVEGFGDAIFIEAEDDDVNQEAVTYNDILMDSLYVDRIAGLQRFYGNIFKSVEMEQPKLK